MITAVDSSVLLDVMIGGMNERDLADRALDHAKRDGTLIVSIIVYAELAGRFPSTAAVDEFLSMIHCSLVPLEEPEAHLAGRFFREYKARGGGRDRILPDFFVAAHAQLRADRLLTRDIGFFGTKFPHLKAVAPTDLS